MIRILLDSSADYTAEELKKLDMELVPIAITMGEKSFRDGIDITKDEFYEMLTSSDDFPKTSQPSPQDFLDIFEDAKEKGDSIIYLSLSSGLSLSAENPETTVWRRQGRIPGRLQESGSPLH